MKTNILTVAVLGSALALGACSTNPFTGEGKISNTGLGLGLGGATGAAAGAIIGGSSKSISTRKAALIGAGVGALAGAGVGAYVDQQETALRRRLENTGVSVTRNGDNLILNMRDNVSFQFGSADIQPQFFDTLNSVALVLKEFNRSLIDVNGHTDDIGTDQANLQLSIERAEAVANYLAGQQVNPQRLSVQGFGESQPVASNADDTGRAENRRVEIRIVPLTEAS